MTNRWVWAAASLMVALPMPAMAQKVRWNDRAATDTTGDAPMVQVMIDGPRVFGYGDAVRVRFSVSDDAYVIVARVDGNGHLTLLYPANRTSSLVSAGENIPVRGRRSGSWATFFANDRMSGGFVFAMASYDPFDLSRLTARDFDRYVTGMYVGRPSRVYIGDPHRVVSRFAQLVSYDAETPFDYDVDFYQVDSPTWVTSAGYSRYCNYSSYRPSLMERWDDEQYYGYGYGYGYGSSGLGCSRFNGWSSYCLSLQALYSYGIGSCFGGVPGNQIARGPRYPTSPSDTTRRTNPWVGDSLSRPDTVSRVPGGGRTQQAVANGQIVVDAIRRPPVTDYDDGDRVFSIPDRALRNIRRNREGLQTPPSEPGPRTGAIAGDQQIRWVRPPRDIDRRTGDNPNAEGNGVVPRDTRRGGETPDRGFDGGRAAVDRERLPTRRSAPPRSEEPTRTYGGSRGDSPPPSIRANPEIHSSPPPRSEPRPQPVRDDPPRIERRDPPPPPKAPPVREPAEKKPEKQQD